MPTTDKIGEAGPLPKAPSARPLDDVGQLALDVARFRNHVAAATALDQAAQQTYREMQELNARLAQLNGTLQAQKDQVILFVAEARDQAGVLINKHGLTQEQVDGLATIPRVFDALNLATTVPAGIGNRKA